MSGTIPARPDPAAVADAEARVQRLCKAFHHAVTHGRSDDMTAAIQQSRDLFILAASSAMSKGPSLLDNENIMSAVFAEITHPLNTRTIVNECVRNPAANHMRDLIMREMQATRPAQALAVLRNHCRTA